MALIVEDGSGLADAESYVTVVDADAWHAARDKGAWGALTVAEREDALRRATRYVNNTKLFPYRGTKKTYEQRMEWPRTGATEYRGGTVPDTVVPWRVIDAVLTVALRAVTTELEPTLARGGMVQAKRIGELSTTYAPGAPAHDVHLAVEGLLMPLLRDRADDPLPGFTAPDTDPSFSHGMHDNTRWKDDP